MINNQKLKAFIPTINPKKAKEFYQNLLDLKLISEDNFAMEFDFNDTIIRINTVPSLTPHPFTILGWDVDDIINEINHLNSKGIIFEKYDFLEQNALGIWTAPSGTKVAWFKDPDGNLLSLSE